ncbi:109aa long hypothetical protein [Pyrococcus horikoshii OT3]|uniref:Uncharacterized protein n=1 Tax=Pyrococcus horikoshii (strain ATCC 700860 / DSM 12428 / JCM 9974 / NBRC 100139 / OT-3) TaxID=70601 RepID=O57992_PYRHO|nr:109aa long hypothetical protein [Pyrococcus horikoshii OT3]
MNSINPNLSRSNLVYEPGQNITFPITAVFNPLSFTNCKASLVPSRTKLSSTFKMALAVALFTSSTSTFSFPARASWLPVRTFLGSSDAWALIFFISFLTSITAFATSFI